MSNTTATNHGLNSLGQNHYSDALRATIRHTAGIAYMHDRAQITDPDLLTGLMNSKRGMGYLALEYMGVVEDIWNALEPCYPKKIKNVTVNLDKPWDVSSPLTQEFLRLTHGIYAASKSDQIGTEHLLQAFLSCSDSTLSYKILSQCGVTAPGVRGCIRAYCTTPPIAAELLLKPIESTIPRPPFPAL